MSLLREFKQSLLTEEDEMLMEKLITFAGQAYPKFGTVIIMAGGAGSGKGFVLKNLVGAEGYVADVDALKTLASNTPAIIKKVKDEMGIDMQELSRNLKNPDNVSKLHDIIGGYLKLDDKKLEALYRSIITSDPDRKPNLIFDVTLKDLQRFANLTRTVKQLGYDDKRIHLVWVVNDIEVAMKQNAERSRTVPVDILVNTHRGVSSTMNDVLKMGEKIKKYMDGDIVIAFNKSKVDAELVKGEKKANVMFPSRKPEAAAYVKSANFFYMKKAGQPLKPFETVEKDILAKIAAYVPAGVVWENVETDGEALLEGFKKLDKEQHSYTVHQIGLNGSVKNKEHMNSEAEVDEWMKKVHGKYANISVKQDKTGKVVNYTDDGKWFTPVKKLKESHLTESAIDLSNFSIPEMVATIVDTKSNGRFGTYQKSGKDHIVKLRSGEEVKVSGTAKGFKVTMGTLSAEGEDIEDAMHDIMQKSKAGTVAKQRPAQKGQDGYIVVDGSGRTLTTHPTLKGAQKLADRYKSTGKIMMEEVDAELVAEVLAPFEEANASKPMSDAEKAEADKQAKRREEEYQATKAKRQKVARRNRRFM